MGDVTPVLGHGPHGGWLSDIEDAPVVSRHNEPQPTPQEWDCGCVTAIYITDRDYRRNEKPFEMRLVHSCDGSACAITRRG